MGRKMLFILISAILFPCILYAQTYTVKNGDNLWEISKKFKVSVEDIKKANHLRDNKLKIGMKLEIPDVKTKNTKNQTITNTQVTTVTTTKYHTVKKGDNLFRIANKYGITVTELKSLNKLESNQLKIGQKLIVKKASVKNESVRSDERVPVLSTAKIDNEIKLDEIEEIKASEDISQLNIIDRMLLFAKKMLHLPYKFGGNGFNGLDCSFFVKKVYSMVGIELPRSAREQFAHGIPVQKEELKPGDLVFFRTYAKFPSHVGIYIGDNLFIHASSRSKKVTIDSLDAPYYVKRFIGAKRILDIDIESLEKAIEEVKTQDS